MTMVLCCTIHISRLAWPRCVPAPSRIQTPDNCPPQLLPHAPAPSYPKDGGKKSCWTNWRLPDFSHMPCKVCVQSGHFLSAFPSTAKTSENMSAWPIEMKHVSQCFSRLVANILWNCSRFLNYFKTRRWAVQRMLKNTTLEHIGTLGHLGGIPL